MPAPASTKRLRGVQIHRPFVFGSEAVPFDPANRPRDAPPDHTHRWRVFVRGIPTSTTAGQQNQTTDISHWLKKVQFKLHDTYANSVRMIESPPFEVEETGWGEFEIAIKFYFVPESGEKPQQLWHALKLHPYTGDIEKQKAERTMVKSVCYEEVVFSEPVEALYDVLTGGGDGSGQARGKGGKGTKNAGTGHLKTAEIPARSDGANFWSREEESKELDRLGEAVKTVEKMIVDEKAQLVAEEKKLAQLEKTEGKLLKKR
ncbi:NuA4 histone H4 acetyltransferase complex and the SWR1 complex subunit [Knufia obscura]|uniref:Protein AF-9 homolog n=2 Tax=Knufia TaxID=430999 RepID=A0AAN8ELR6_9EURO|nr:NuA4 histone H4 acetyltransferase complex and the SWR1 complex subunit [Knufia obscura]KAK5956605.1 NuA4 histone H4 acetyltransferase complex and the SWR1 complex subunit [Knufia fluminis]